MAIIGCWALVFLCIPSIIAFDEAPLTIAVFDIIDDVSNPGTERQYNIKGYEAKRLLATVDWKHINTNITNIYQVRSLYDGHYDIYIFSPEMCEETFMLDIVAPGNLSINCVVPSSSSYSSSVADSSSFFLPGAAIPDDDKMCVYEQNGKKKTEIVASVLSHLGWVEVIVLYDHQTKNDVIALTAGLLGVTIVLYDIDIDDIGNDSDDFIDVIYDFYNRTDSKSRNFLLMCSQSCIDTVIQKASGFDKRFKGATALSVFSKWLVVNLEGKTELQDESSVDLDNVAVLNFPFNDERTSQKLFINRLKTVIHSTSMENDVNENMTSIFLEALEKELTTHTDCWRAELFTLLWKPEGRKFSPVGHVNYTGHVTMPSDVIIFPNTQFGLNGRVLKITTLEWHPFNLKKPSVNGTLSYEGYCFDLLNILQHAINFSYTLCEPEDGLWGDLKNGTWTGVVGQLYRREVDLHVGPLGISSARETAVDFTFPIYYFYSVVIFRLPDPNKDKWRKLIEPFTWQVHVCVVSAFCGTILFLYVIESVNPFYIYTKKRRPKFQNIVLYLYGALLAHEKKMAFLIIVTLTLTIVGFVHGEMTEEAKNQILQLHNEHRGNLGASNMFKLTWDDDLAREATEWNNACVYKHKGLGENLAWNKPASPLPVNELIETAFNDWYEEKNLHSYGSKSCAGSGSCHYTQLAWHDTSRIGCSYTTCSYLTNSAADAWWIVCMYNPKGNTKRENVFEMGAACSHPDCEGLTCEKNLCVDDGKVKCEDTNKNCLQWAKANQCAVNPTYMKDTCPKSCKICTRGPETPSSAAGRSLIAAWWIFCVITGATFSGTLIASLTVSKVNVPFKTLSQLASQDVYKWGTVDGTVWSLMMTGTNVSDFQKLWAGIKRFNVTDPEVLDKDMEVHRRKVEEDNYAFIADHLSAELWREQSCNLAILDEVFYPLNVGFALQNHSPLLEYFNNEMMKIIESGVAQILRKDWWPNPNACTEATTSAKTIELADIQSAFYVMMIGIVLAALVIFIESCFVVSVDGVHFRFSSKMDARNNVINS